MFFQAEIELIRVNSSARTLLSTLFVLRLSDCLLVLVSLRRLVFLLREDVAHKFGIQHFGSVSIVLHRASG